MSRCKERLAYVGVFFTPILILACAGFSEFLQMRNEAPPPPPKPPPKPAPAPVASPSLFTVSDPQQIGRGERLVRFVDKETGQAFVVYTFGERPAIAHIPAKPAL